MGRSSRHKSRGPATAGSQALPRGARSASKSGAAGGVSSVEFIGRRVFDYCIFAHQLLPPGNHFPWTKPLAARARRVAKSYTWG